MPRKTSDQHQNNSRLGALGESLVQTFLLEYADFCYPTQEKHPADLMVEFGSAKYTVQVKSRRATKEKKFVLMILLMHQVENYFDAGLMFFLALLHKASFLEFLAALLGLSTVAYFERKISSDASR